MRIILCILLMLVVWYIFEFNIITHIYVFFLALFSIILSIQCIISEKNLTFALQVNLGLL